jgi:hypothetical protein
MDVRTVLEQVGPTAHRRRWVEELDRIGPPPEPPPVLSPDGTADLLTRLTAPTDLIPALVATRPSPSGDPVLWWLFERAHHRLTAGIGDDRTFAPSPDGTGPWGAWPELPGRLGDAGRSFAVHLFLAAVPTTRRWHESQGIDPQVSWDTLDAIGRHIHPHPERPGVAHIPFPPWLVLHVRGGIFRLGRLEFQRGHLRWTDEQVAAAQCPVATGEPVLDLHIPPTGPLTSEAVDDAFARARAFFSRHFPAHSSRWAVCSSWLLDPQLTEYLPPTTNIVRFQQRFRRAPGRAHPATDATVNFVFRRPPADLDDLPQETSLQRAIVAHVRADRSWDAHAGWCDLDERAP